jgi:hypothetical protein
MVLDALLIGALNVVWWVLLRDDIYFSVIVRLEVCDA